MNRSQLIAVAVASLVSVGAGVVLLEDEALDCVTVASTGYARLLVDDLDAGLPKGVRLVTCQKRLKSVTEKLDLRAQKTLPPGCVWLESYGPDGGIDDVGVPEQGDCWTTLGGDGGQRWPGAWNAIPVEYARGAGCRPVTCVADEDPRPVRQGVPRTFSNTEPTTEPL